MVAARTTIHIIYGVPCAGKSTTALAFAHRRDIRTVIHTDYLREVQRHYVPRETVPVLARVTHDAWELYGPPTPANIRAGFLDHVAAVFPAIQVVTDKLVSDGFDSVVEGVHFHGELIEILRGQNRQADIRATLLTVGTGEELLRRAISKGHARTNGLPLKEWRENIPAMLAIQEFLVADAEERDIDVTTATEWRESWGLSDVRRWT
ncbi:2-phosphoglycerate kinase [Pseudofrankia inefficax]|uniref:2-phosphoglycerate kinase n=1 Tax=Pseudofrankia inefficax (strain DSM 45817 / CECT 9037 / DDB 130130 / EuI1c) TaxID=298654 RepID=E3J8U2_PSEI1|nr:2-phosphoglycerate kinase [Pseudofrankia inefficax]ADP79675.1 2-phosphoglycerate kinase [Pseudofrankia inefficax]